MPSENKIKKLEADQIFQNDFNDNPPSDIVAFNELRSCADLIRMYESNQLDIRPDFQREIVWSRPDQTRFIDSLTKQLPIPSMCISLDYKRESRIIIDGLQRMTSIINFLTKKDWELSVLADIDRRLSGNTVLHIKKSYPALFAKVQNLMIPITVIRCDLSKKSHSEYIFTIFHRLNSGGVKLNNQEIRNCIYNGRLNSLLKTLANDTLWKKFAGVKEEKTYRFMNEELILRLFAFNENLELYDGKLSKFLNDYMHSNRDPDKKSMESKKELFSRTIALIYHKMLGGKSVSKHSKVIIESLMVGVSKNIDKLEKKSSANLRILYKRFLRLSEFSVDNLKEGLSAKDKVKRRLRVAIKHFSK